MMRNKKTVSNTFFAKSLSCLHPYTASQIEDEYWHHRSPWMEEKLSRITYFFKSTFGKNYTPLIITGTEQAALEAIVTNLTHKASVVWVSKSSSWTFVSDALLDTVTNIDQTKNSLPSQTKPDIVLLDDVSPDGKKYDFVSLSKCIKKQFPKAEIVVNVSTSFGADLSHIKQASIDGYVLVPERALASIPGLSITILKNSVFKSIERVRALRNIQPYSFDLLKYFESWKKNDTPYSPDISASVGLNATLEVIESNGGVKKYVATQQIYAKTIRSLLISAGLKSITPTSSATNAFTIFSLPPKVGRSDVVRSLEQSGITLDPQPSNESQLLIGHTGYLTPPDTESLISAIRDCLKTKPLSTKEKDAIKALPTLHTPSTHALDSKIFTIPISDWHSAVDKKVQSITDKKIALLTVTASEEVFNEKTLLNYCYKDRVLGFIGAGNTVREAVWRCQALGIKNIIIYSPSLAKQKKSKKITGSPTDHKTLSYWRERGVEVANSARDVFLSTHTVVLLPTFYTKQSAKLLGKSPEYVNEKLVNQTLLNEIETKGKMDLLINASAREGLIERKALVSHVKKGWLCYHSDETPTKDDPVSHLQDVRMTAHVGGSCPQPQKAVASNTRIIIKILTSTLMNKLVDQSLFANYRMSVMNQHLEPKTGWRISNHNSKVGESKVIKILMTDSFDHGALNFNKLEKECGVSFEIIDSSFETPNESNLKKLISRHKPNFIMVRTRTIITDRVAKLIKKTPEVQAIIRPGVGVDSLYGGMKTLSEAGVQIINEPFGNSFSVGEMATHFVLRGVEKTILAPGPTRYNREVFASIHDYPHPNSPAYKKTVTTLQKDLYEWIGIDTKPFFHSIPSTGFMEASITNLTRAGDRGLVIAHGKFGKRFKEISIAKEREVKVLEVEDEQWGRAFSPAEVSAQLRKDAMFNQLSPFQFLTIQQNETSAGVSYKQNHLESIVKIARAYNPDIIIILDGVSGIFAHDIDVKKLDVDVVVLGSQKGLGVSSGITYASISNRALQKMLNLVGYKKAYQSFLIEHNREKFIEEFGKMQSVHYLNLLRLITESHLKGTPMMTPSVFHMQATQVALKKIQLQGRKETIQKSIQYAKKTRAMAVSLGLSLLSSPPYISNSLTPIVLPESISAPELRKGLEQHYGILVAGAQCAFLKPSLLRIGHFGFVTNTDTARCLRALRILLSESKHHD